MNANGGWRGERVGLDSTQLGGVWRCGACAGGRTRAGAATLRLATKAAGQLRTSRYLDARLTNLRSAETQYQQIMAQATTIDDVLRVQRVLSETRGEIEQLTAERDRLADRAALATLTVNGQTPLDAVATTQSGWSVGREVDRAFATLVGLSQGLASIAIWIFIAVMPIAVPAILIGIVGYRILRPRPNRVTMGGKTPAADG